VKEQATLTQGGPNGFWNTAFVADTIQIINYTPDAVYLRIGDNVAASPTSYHNIIPPMTTVTLPVNTKHFSGFLGPVYLGGYTAPYAERVDIIWTAQEVANNAAQFSLSSLTVPQPVQAINMTGQAAPFNVDAAIFTARSRWLRLHWRYQNFTVAPTGFARFQVDYGPPGTGIWLGSAGAVILQRVALSASTSNFSDFYVRPGDDIQISVYDWMCPAGEVWDIAIWYEFIDKPDLIFPHAYRMCHRAMSYNTIGVAHNHGVVYTLSSNSQSTGMISNGFAYRLNADVLPESLLLEFREVGSNLPLARYEYNGTDDDLWAPATDFSTVDALNSAGHHQRGDQPPFGGLYKKQTVHPFEQKLARPVNFIAPNGVYVLFTVLTAACHLDLLMVTFEYFCPL
jgi:hypothetical protein